MATNAEPRRGSLNGVYAGIASGLAFGVMGVISKRLFAEVPPQQVVLVLGAFGSLLLLPYALKEAWKVLSPAGSSLAVRSVAAGISVLCLFMNFRDVSVGDANALANLAPVFAFFIALFALRERVSFAELLGVLLLVSGALFLRSPFGSALPFEALVIGAVGAVFAAISYVSLRRASQLFRPATIVWAFSVGVTAIAFPFVVPVWVTPTIPSAGLLIAVSSLAMLGQFLVSMSFARLTAAVGAALTLTSLLWSVSIEALLTNALPSFGTLVGYGIILAGTFVSRFGALKRVSRSDWREK